MTVRLTGGADAGTEITTELPAGPGAVQVDRGDDIVLLLLQETPGGAASYSILDHQRSTQLWALAAAFALAVIAFGRWRGLTALAGLGVTFAVLLMFIVPAILNGRSPVLVAIVGAAAIMLTVLYLTHGFTTTTTSIAVAGTLISLSITAALSAAAAALTHLSGVADETANYLNVTQSDVNMRGLLLAGIVIGSLGVLDDVTVTQSATVTELAIANPAYRFGQLYGAATRIGRAHIASVINTIVLAYAGASLPLMLLFAAGDTPVRELLTGELIAQELVRSVVGTIGLITAVPVTTALAAAIAARARPSDTPATAPAPDTAGEPQPVSRPPAETRGRPSSSGTPDGIKNTDGEPLCGVSPRSGETDAWPAEASRSGRGPQGDDLAHGRAASAFLADRLTAVQGFVGAPASQAPSVTAHRRPTRTIGGMSGCWCAARATVSGSGLIRPPPSRPRR